MKTVLTTKGSGEHSNYWQKWTVVHVSVTAKLSYVNSQNSHLNLDIRKLIGKSLWIQHFKFFNDILRTLELLYGNCLDNKEGWDSDYWQNATVYVGQLTVIPLPVRSKLSCVERDRERIHILILPKKEKSKIIEKLDIKSMNTKALKLQEFWNCCNENCLDNKGQLGRQRFNGREKVFIQMTVVHVSVTSDYSRYAP